MTGSRDSGQQLRWERTYRQGPLYAPLTGYASQTYGTTLVEDAEDAVLAGTEPMLAPLPLLNGLTRGREPGGDVLTTIRGPDAGARLPGAGRQAGRGGGGRAGHRPDPGARQLPLVRPGVLSGTGPGSRGPGGG